MCTIYRIIIIHFNCILSVRAAVQCASRLSLGTRGLKNAYTGICAVRDASESSDGLISERFRRAALSTHVRVFIYIYIHIGFQQAKG